MTKKVIVLTSTYPRWENDTEPSFVHQLSSLLSKKHDVHILAPFFIGSEMISIMDNLIIHRFRYFFSKFETLTYNGGILANLKKNKLKYLLIPFFILSQFFTLLLLHRKYHFEIIHAHWIIPQGIVGALFKNFYPDSKLIITSHGGDLFSLNSKFFKIMKRWILSNADHITVVSEAMKELCMSWNIDEKKIHVISMGVDLNNTFVSMTPYRQRNGLIFVGRLVEKKGVRYLITSLSRVVEKHPDIKLTIVGDGPDKSDLEKMTSRLNLSKHIKFTGPVPNNKIPEILNSCSIAIMPSITTDDGDQEGLGLAAIEAIGCGCTIIASDLPAVRDIINSDTGVLVPEKSPDELATSIIHLLADTDHAEKLATKGNAFVKNKFDWEIKAKKYEELYR